jgi:uncharacterized protein YuzE
VRVTHSVGGDAAYIYLKEISEGEAVWQHLVDDERARGMVVLDFDADGKLIGIEVVGASHGLPAEVLEGAEQIDTG